MANEADQADELNELFLNISLANARNKVVDSPVSKDGKCLFCEEVLEASEAGKPQKRWCDRDCRDDWQRIENSRRQKTGQALLTSEMLGE